MFQSTFLELLKITIILLLSPMDQGGKDRDHDELEEEDGWQGVEGEVQQAD